MKRQGFTLTELLITIVIVAMLAGMAYPVLYKSRQSVMIQKTENLIERLHYAVMREYELLRIGPRQTEAVAYPQDGSAPFSLRYGFADSPQEANEVSLNLRYDYIRMCMPERFADVADESVIFELGPQLNNGKPRIINSKVVTVKYRNTRPSLSQRFARLIKQNPPSGDYDSAECLYMVVMSNSENAEQFKQRDRGDADGDGLPEFRDAWGNPIKFLRWAPAYTYSDTQSGDPVKQHDHFDHLRTFMPPGDGSNPRRGCLLLPLIYSAGPDGIYDVNVGRDYHYSGDPWTYPDGSASRVGEPIDSDNVSVTATEDADGEPSHYDNISNHRMIL